MPDHPQTATERFLRHGVAGGYLGGETFAKYKPKTRLITYDLREGLVNPPTKTLGDALLDPALWEAAGRSLGWNDIATNPENVSWLEHQHRLIDHLAAHPGDVEGYMASLLDDDPLPHQEPCNCRDCSLTDAKGTE